jgi:hypothetical protein
LDTELRPEYGNPEVITSLWDRHRETADLAIFYWTVFYWIVRNLEWTSDEAVSEYRVSRQSLLRYYA